MTKVQIIEQIIETKGKELEVVYQGIKTRTETVIIPGYKAIVDKYFNSFTSEDIITKVSSDGETITFLRPHEDYTYNKDLMDIRLRTNWKTDEIIDISTSVYSTSDNSLWELERLQVVGQIASVLIDFKDDFIAEMTNFREGTKEETKALRQAGYDIEQDIRNCEAEISRMETEATEALLNGEGLVFNNKLASVNISWNNSVRGISKARITNKTASGKSADLELTLNYGYGDNVTETVRTYSKVRMSNVENLVWQYRDSVLNATV